MASLHRNLRRDLENAVKKARRVAEAGGRQAVEQLAVHHHQPWTTLSADQSKLRNRLRAHGRQLGDGLDERRGTQSIDRLVAECAYEHWHRLLFARFLAENDLLIEPESGMALSLGECQELARERGTDWLPLASGFAQGMLPQIFRAGDPVLEVTLPPETRQTLEQILAALPREVFVADDSLGWVYQFWQAETKEAVDRALKSGGKAGAAEIPAKTQLFTEDYMVLFLLENALGAWWAGRHLAKHPELAASAESEDALRTACSPPGTVWRYLRFTRAGGEWRPAAGVFERWPKTAADLRLLDPCMGSGHFLVFALPILVSFRQVEEGLSVAHAVRAVLRDNLFGLELDPRCTQIAAFNLALAAWRMAGHQALPALHLACSGLGVNAKEAEWLALAGDDQKLRAGMERLYRLFKDAPVLGSLINPRVVEGDLLEAAFHELQPLLEKALAQEAKDDTAHEMVVTARGLAKAAEILAGQFTLVATNVPFLGRGKQVDVLQNFCDDNHREAKADLSTCFVERCVHFTGPDSTIAVVTPQNWLFLATYRSFRKELTRCRAWELVARLGPNAFRDMNWWHATTALIVLSSSPPLPGHLVRGLDVSPHKDQGHKAILLSGGAVDSRRAGLQSAPQATLAADPELRIVLREAVVANQLSEYAAPHTGMQTGDNDHYSFAFWELPQRTEEWEFFHRTSERTSHYSGRFQILRWEKGSGSLASEPGRRIAGLNCVGQAGILVHRMNQLPVTLYTGEIFDQNGAVILTKKAHDLTAVWCYLSSDSYGEEVRCLDTKTGVTPKTLAAVPFDVAHWKRTAAQRYPHGLPKPLSSDPTQWLFNGHPKGADQPLHVAVARLLGYQWPRQTGSSFLDCPALGPDGLDARVDEDGIVCVTSLRGEASAADRLRALLAAAYGAEWSPARQSELLKHAGFAGTSLEEWLREAFFEQHCALFHQHPFVWHIWDGLKSGFGALVNYHRLAGPNGEGRRTIEKLIYTYLGDWIDRQRADQTAGVEGADARVASAEHLKRELERILEGEPPYDLFVRWKPLHEQPVGWEPDINDGVRLNIRPFMTTKPFNARGRNACILRVSPKIKWDKDRGKEPQRPKRDFPWFWGWDEQAQDFAGGKDFDGNRWNDLHYTRALKEAARKRPTQVAKP